MFYSQLTPLDPDEYLPHATLMWCQSSLYSIGIEAPICFEQHTLAGEELHWVAYLHLKHAIFCHIQQGNEPKLSLTPRPVGAYNWRPNLPNTSEGPSLENDLLSDLEDEIEDGYSLDYQGRDDTDEEVDSGDVF